MSNSAIFNQLLLDVQELRSRFTAECSQNLSALLSIESTIRDEAQPHQPKESICPRLFLIPRSPIDGDTVNFPHRELPAEPFDDSDTDGGVTIANVGTISTLGVADRGSSRVPSWTPANDRNAWDMMFAESIAGVSASRSSYARSSTLTATSRPQTAVERWSYLYDKFTLHCNSQITILHPAWTEVQRSDEGKLMKATSSNPAEADLDVLQMARSRRLQKSASNINIGLGVGHVASHTLQKIASHSFLMNPHCKLRLSWDFFSALICLYDLIMWPIYWFELDAILLSQHSMITKYIELAVVIFWTSDMLMSCMTGYQTSDGHIEVRLAKIVRRYAKTWFTFDALLVIVDWFLFFNVVNQSDKLFESLKGVRRFLRVFRLSRLLRLIPKLHEIVGELNSEYVLSLIGLFGSLFIILLLNHYIASSWCYYWAESHPEKSDEVSTWYLTGLHWALATSTLGSTDIFPQSSFERLYTCVNIALALVVFSTFVSKITETIAHLGELRHQQVMKERAIRKYLHDYRIPRMVSCQVWRFIRRNKLTEDCIREGEVEVLDLLPVLLKQQLKFESVHRHMLTHPLFLWIDQRFPTLMHQICINAAYTMFMRPFSSMLWSTVDGVNRMIFLVSGLLDYRPENGKRCFAHPGQWVCEEPLWSRSALLDGPLHAGNGGATLVLIQPTEFQDVIRANSACSHVVRRYARRFVEEFNKASLATDDEEEDLLFNDIGVLADILAGACEEELALPAPKRRSMWFGTSLFDATS